MHAVIIGNGISGITCARWIRKFSDHKITIISSESKYFYSRTALMYVYMGHMQFKDIEVYERGFWEENSIELLEDRVLNIDFGQRSLTLGSGGELAYDKLVLALGSSPNRFGWLGQDLKGVGSLHSLQDLELIESCSKGLDRAVIVGGGLIGIELAEMFHSRKIAVTMLVREKNYYDNALPEEEAKLISRHIVHHGIDLRLGTNLEEIIDDGTGKVKSVKVKETGEIIECGFVGLTAGVRPNVDILKNSEIELDRGILVDQHLQSNIADVYAIGDCAQLKTPREGRHAIEAVWYTGRMMGKTAALNICGKTEEYDPGIWHNSAKFMDIEYHVYGTVLPTQADEHRSFFWEDRAAEKSVRIVFEAGSEAVIGFNLFGIRFRHEVCDKWIEERTAINEVMEHIELANFNPEFYKAWSKDLVEAFNKDMGRNVQLKAELSLDHVLAFLKS